MNRNLKLLPILGIFALLLTPRTHGQVDDVYENNDTPGQARLSEFNFTDSETLLGLRQLDDDWYYFVVSPEDGNTPQNPPLASASITLRIECLFNHATAGNIDVEVYVESRFDGEQGARAQGRFFMFAQPFPGDTVTIGNRVYTWQVNGTSNADRQIDIGANLAGAQTNFVAAVNGTDGNNAAHPSVTASAFVGFTSVITANAEGTLGNTIETTETSINTSFDDDTLGALRLGADPAMILVAVANSTTDNESITLSNMAPGRYYIRVFGPNTGGAYSLWWNILEDDAYEENDSYEQARLNPSIPEAVTLTSLRQVDEDWYKIEILESGNVDLVVRVNFVQATAGNIDVEVYNSTGSSVIGRGDSNTDNESITVLNVTPGTYYIRVYAGGPDANIGGEYTLWWRDIGEFEDLPVPPAPPVPPVPPDYSAEVNYYSGLASYNYYYHSYFGDSALAYANYYYYQSLSVYYASLSNGNNINIASYYFNEYYALYLYHAFAGIGDYQSASMYYYYYLALAYYYYYVGIGDVSSANAVYGQILSYAFG